MYSVHACDTNIVCMLWTILRGGKQSSCSYDFHYDRCLKRTTPSAGPPTLCSMRGTLVPGSRLWSWSSRVARGTPKRPLSARASDGIRVKSQPKGTVQRHERRVQKGYFNRRAVLIQIWTVLLLTYHWTWTLHAFFIGTKVESKLGLDEVLKGLRKRSPRCDPVRAFWGGHV